MQAPRRVASFTHVVHGAARHVRRLGILLVQARRFARVPHRPARRKPVAFALRRIGVVVPGIVAGIAFVVEIAVVARQPRIVAPVGPDAVQTVVALVGIEAALGHPHPDDRCRIDTKPLHPFDVRLHVGLADERRRDPERTQIVAERHLADLERKSIPRRTVRLHVAPGVEAHARGAADRRLHIGAREPHATRRQRVDVRRAQRGMARAGQVIPAQLVAHDEQDVFGSPAHRSVPNSRCSIITRPFRE